MSKFTSPYYPPRARWYGKFFTISNSTRRRLALDRIRLPPHVTFGEFVASLLVPGYAFWARAPRRWGTAALIAAVVLVLSFFVGLGQSFGNAAFGLLLSLHSTGIVYILEPTLAKCRLRFRIAVSCAAMAALYFFLYSPSRNFIENHWLLPLRIRGHVVVVQRMASPQRVHRGDWVAYSFSEHTGDHIIAIGGFGYGEVLAMAGDRVRFSQTACEINGRPRLLLPHMPTNGELVMREKTWFIWPDFDIGGGHGYVAESAISSTFLRMATVDEEQFVGKPFKHWFGRRQVSPEAR